MAKLKSELGALGETVLGKAGKVLDAGLGMVGDAAHTAYKAGSNVAGGAKGLAGRVADAGRGAVAGGLGGASRALGSLGQRISGEKPAEETVDFGAGGGIGRKETDAGEQKDVYFSCSEDEQQFNALVVWTLVAMINSRPEVAPFGRITSLRFKGGYISCELELLGLEAYPITIRCGHIAISEDGASVTLSDFSSNRRFVRNALNNFAAKPWPVNDPNIRQMLMAFRFILNRQQEGSN